MVKAFPGILGWVSLRYLFRHPWQTILMIAGIALGVSVVVAIDLANSSANQAFDLSTQSLTGRATHQILGGPDGLSEQVYTKLRRSSIPEPIAPLISGYITSPQLGELPLQILGIDPFADAPFRSYLGEKPASSEEKSNIPGATAGDLTAFLTQPGAILISQELADRYQLKLCPSGKVDPQSTEQSCNITVESGGRRTQSFLAGIIQTANADTPQVRLLRRSLAGLILADISTAQEITGKIGRLDQIDLILPSEEGNGLSASLQRIQVLLPAGARIEEAAARSSTIREMTAAFRLNLSALSLLALVVGMFLIYNTMTFSVVQRRGLYGTLRCLGVTRQEIFGMILYEALAAGLIGSIMGGLLGVLLGQGAVRLVTQTINDLFFVITVRGVQIPPGSLVKGVLVGLGATTLSACLPALEAAAVPPRAALSRSGLETKVNRYIRLALLGGITLFILGCIILVLPWRSLTFSFIATLSMLVGFALLTPFFTRELMRHASPALGKVWGTLGRMAPRSVVSSLSRTSIAVMALMVAVSVTIGVSLMISSFRHTVQVWLKETLQGDIYISTPGLNANQTTGTIDPVVVDSIRTWQDVRRVEVLRAVGIQSPAGIIQVAASSNPEVGEERLFKSLSLPSQEIWRALMAGSVLVSEPLAERLRLPERDAQLELYTPSGVQSFPVVGVYYDYSSSEGNLLMALPYYQQVWGDLALTAIQLRLEPGIETEGLVRSLQDNLPTDQHLLVRSNQSLRADVLQVFDRTFAITAALQLLAMFVAFIGVLSALLSLELERQRELGILRAVGLTIRQLWGLIFMETGLLGAVAGLLAMPAGYMLALVLVYIINKRSFGWTLQMQVEIWPFIEALLIALLAALLAGVYPARRIGQMLTSEALHSE